MCAQCMAAALTAGTAATGLRAWLVARQPSWLTAQRKRRLSVALVLSAILAAGVIGT